MIEKTVNLDLEKTFDTLKTAFVQKGCKLKTEQPPIQFTVIQGSLWGLTPIKSKKTIEAKLESASAEATKVTFFSNLSSDWKNTTIVGCILASVLVAICLWITVDLTNFVNTGSRSFWSWLIENHGMINYVYGQALTSLTRALATFLFVIVVLEAVVTMYAYRKVDQFAEETFNSIIQKN